MERITGTLLAALVVCGLLAPGAASAATVADGSVTDAADGHTVSLVDVGPPDPDDDSDTTNTTDSATDTTDTTDTTTDTTDTTDTTTDTVENTTDPDDDSDTTNTTDSTTDTVENTTDTVENTTDSTTDAVENTTDTVENTTDSTTDAVDNTTETVENTTDSTTDTVENTTDTVENTTDMAEETVDSTTDGVEETTDSATDTVAETGDTVENTTDDGSLDVELSEDVLSEDDTADANLSAAVGGDGSLAAESSLDVDAGADGDSDVDGTSDADADGQSDLDGGATVGDGDGEDANGADADVGDADADDGATAAFTPLGTRPLPGDVPVGSGTAALGGALALGTGYAGRRALAVGAGPAPGTTLTQARLTASVFADAVRARELPDWVRWLPVVGGYSRYDSTDPLAHEKRATIVEHLEASPGTYLSALAEETGIALPTVRYHMKILAHEDCVESEVIRGKRRYFPSGFETAELAAALADEATRDVLHALEVEEPASVSRLAEVLDRDPSTVTHHCKRLQEDGLVERERDGRAKVSSLTPTVREALQTVPRAGTGETPAPADD